MLHGVVVGGGEACLVEQVVGRLVAESMLRISSLFLQLIHNCAKWVISRTLAFSAFGVSRLLVAVLAIFARDFFEILRRANAFSGTHI